MSSEKGSGSDITLQDAVDLLHKLAIEVTKVQVAFNSACGITVAILGLLKICPDGRWAVVDGDGPTARTIFFDPRLATGRTYGDTRTFPPRSNLPGAPTFSSAICFVFLDQSLICLFEVFAK